MTAPETCIPNIGARGVRRRRIGGIVWLVLALAASRVLIVRGAPLGGWLPLIVPFTLAALGYLQAREKTWVVLATLGERDAELGGGALGAADRSVVRRQAARVLVMSIAAGLACTAVVLGIGALAGRVRR